MPKTMFRWRFKDGPWVVGDELPWYAERGGYEWETIESTEASPLPTHAMVEEAMDYADRCGEVRGGIGWAYEFARSILAQQASKS